MAESPELQLPGTERRVGASSQRRRGGCFAFLRRHSGCFAFQWGRGGSAESRSHLRKYSQLPSTEEDFRDRIEFLQSVPLFRRMPRAQFPVLARVLRVRSWEQGQVVLEYFNSSPRFFLIAHGCATMHMPDENSTEVLRQGDYFGDALLTQRACKRVVAGPDLVTLSMNEQDFKAFELRRYLRCKRKALEPARTPSKKSVFGLADSALQGEQRDFVAEAVRRNANLRSLVKLREEVVQQICDAAEREEVPRGRVLVHRGEYGGRFYIVERGSFELRLNDAEHDHAQHDEQSPCHEHAFKLGESEMSCRIRRKEVFLQSLVHANDLEQNINESLPWHRTMSMSTVDINTHRTLHRAVSGGSSPSKEGAPHPLCRTLSDPLNKVIEADKGTGLTREPSNAAGTWGRHNTEEIVSRADANGEGLVLGVRKRGDSFGEVALLYHAPRTSTAVAIEDSVVWYVDQASFRKIMLSKEQVRVDRVAEELDQVEIFQGLLSHEKKELSQNFLTLTFKQGDWIVREGEFQNVWYILVQGECSMVHTVGDGEEELTALRPVVHFGERALLRDLPSEFSVRAVSEEGVRCLVLDGPTFKELAGLLTDDADFRRAVEDDLTSFAKYKGSRNPKLVGFLHRIDTQKSVCRQDVQGKISNFLDASVGAQRSLDRVGILGMGAFGAVTLERDPSSGELFALKAISKGHVAQNELQESVKNERDIMTMIDSPFTLRLIGTFKDNNFVYFFFEPLLGGDLHTHIHCPETFVQLLRPSVNRFILACVVCGLGHLHERNIVFRDLKSENVLLAANGYAKLCDFGFAKFVLGRTLTLCGTPEYVAPEVIELTGYDRMVDWWALGILTFEVFTSDTPFSKPEEYDCSPVVIFRRVMQGIGNVDIPFSDPDAKAFVKSLLKRSPGKRLGIGGAEQVERDRFFSDDVDFSALKQQMVRAPYVPPLSSDCDLSMFSPDEQDMPPVVEYTPDGSEWDAEF